MRGLLTPRPSETHGRLALPSVWSFAPSKASGPFGLPPWPASSRLLRPLLTSRSALQRRPFRREARSPQVRTPAFTAQSPDLRRVPLVARASRSIARSPWFTAPRIRFLFVDSRLRSPLLSASPRGFRLAVRLGSLRPAPPKDFHLQVLVHAGHTTGRPGPGRRRDPGSRSLIGR